MINQLNVCELNADTETAVPTYSCFTLTGVEQGNTVWKHRDVY